MIELLIIVFVVIIDRIVNFWAATELIKIDTIPIIKDVFHLTYAENTGAAFSMLRDHTIILGFASVAIIIGLAAFLYTHRKGGKVDLLSISLAMIIGGAAGNMIDRFFRGYVVDYFDFRLINFAVFNLADSFVVVGTGFMILYVLLDEIKKRKST